MSKVTIKNLRFSKPEHEWQVKVDRSSVLAYVRPDIVDIWMGDSATRLIGRVCTHFPDAFMLENMLKVQFTQA